MLTITNCSKISSKNAECQHIIISENQTKKAVTIKIKANQNTTQIIITKIKKIIWYTGAMLCKYRSNSRISCHSFLITPQNFLENIVNLEHNFQRVLPTHLTTMLFGFL